MSFLFSQLAPIFSELTRTWVKYPSKQCRGFNSDRLPKGHGAAMKKRRKAQKVARRINRK